MVGALDDVPGVSPGVDVPAPGQRLVPDAKAAPRGALRHFGQIGRGPCVVVDGARLHVAAHQHQIGAERLHDVELAFGAIQVAYPDILGHRLEVAEGLEDGDLQPQPFGDAPDIGRRPVIGQQVVFEDFHTIEPDGGGRLQLLRQGAAEGYGGDRLCEGEMLIGHGRSSTYVDDAGRIRRRLSDPPLVGRAGGQRFIGGAK